MGKLKHREAKELAQVRSQKATHDFSPLSLSPLNGNDTDPKWWAGGQQAGGRKCLMVPERELTFSEGWLTPLPSPVTDEDTGLEKLSA